ncbi:MAG: hypothetical protein IPP73_05990 [Chitinophagaceae bacterium]|nr:hypothetical protein [Chitinophagaceae bacterium]
MRKIILLSLTAWLMYSTAQAQPAPNRHIRIVDTLTPLERSTRNPVILQAELDSLIKEYNTANPVTNLQQNPVQDAVKKETTDNANLIMLLGAVITGLLLWIIYRQGRQQQAIKKWLPAASVKNTTLHAKDQNTKGKNGQVSVETKISDLHAEIHKLSRENEGLSRVIKEYNGIQHEYESLRHGMLKAYKVRNYPGNTDAVEEHDAMQTVLDTESAVARYAYEKFLQPVLKIMDDHKNSPAKLPAAESEKLLDLLVSLSLLYIEYLYLRVNELAIGGKMVERIKGFANGKGPDPASLKKLDTEFGSRALVLRMALDKFRLKQLSYPVFDETNLNHS